MSLNMVDNLSIMSELGDNASLLLMPDAWLENQRTDIQQKMALLAEELGDILTAQRIKCQLQQSNLVAVRHIVRSNGIPSDIVITVSPLADAVRKLERDRSDCLVPVDISTDNARQQMNTWRMDGYDVDITSFKALN